MWYLQHVWGKKNHKQKPWRWTSVKSMQLNSLLTWEPGFSSHGGMDMWRFGHDPEQNQGGVMSFTWTCTWGSNPKTVNLDITLKVYSCNSRVGHIFLYNNIWLTIIGICMYLKCRYGTFNKINFILHGHLLQQLDQQINTQVKNWHFQRIPIV